MSQLCFFGVALYLAVDFQSMGAPAHRLHMSELFKKQSLMRLSINHYFTVLEKQCVKRIASLYALFYSVALRSVISRSASFDRLRTWFATRNLVVLAPEISRCARNDRCPRNILLIHYSLRITFYGQTSAPEFPATSADRFPAIRSARAESAD